MTRAPSQRPTDGERKPSNAEVIAELQAVALAVRLFGLDALPSVMRPKASP